MIRFGLLGCGRIARRHSDLLGGDHIDGAKLVAVCDPVRARADAIAAKFGVPAHDDMDGFLARKDVDAVAVLTPSGLHPQHVIACARAGKHVVVEKPMALRLQDADVREAEDADRNLAPGMTVTVTGTQSGYTTASTNGSRSGSCASVGSDASTSPRPGRMRSRSRAIRARSRVP